MANHLEVECTCGCGRLTKPSISTRVKMKRDGRTTAFIKGHNPRRPALERILEKVEKHDGPNACWIWKGSLDVHGYARVHYNGSSQKVSNVLWILTIGPIPEKLCVLHTCDNPACVRQDHLWLGTKRQNTHDMIAKGRWKKPTGRWSKHYRLIIRDGGQIEFIYDDKLKFLLQEGRATIRRASNVEPNADGQWEVDLAPVGGPVLGPFRLRSEALAAEVAWIERHVFGAPICEEVHK